TLYGFAVHRELGSRARRNNTEKKKRERVQGERETTREGRETTKKGAGLAGWLRFGAPVTLTTYLVKGFGGEGGYGSYALGIGAGNRRRCSQSAEGDDHKRRAVVPGQVGRTFAAPSNPGISTKPGVFSSYLLREGISELLQGVRQHDRERRSTVLWPRDDRSGGSTR
ncbi:hypothetical protein ACWDT6_28345, partial [Nocardia grenadensis]